MPAPSQKRCLTPKARGALELIANGPHGAAEALLLSRGFTCRMLAGLLRSRLVTWHHKTSWAGGRMIEANYMITGAGRQALED
jgi:hypothetical protein